MDVYGISFDAPEENKRFAQEQGFNFPLLCDVRREAGMAYGACAEPNAATARRITYVIGPDNRIEQAIETKHPGTQAQEILDSLPS